MHMPKPSPTFPVLQVGTRIISFTLAAPTIRAAAGDYSGGAAASVTAAAANADVAAATSGAVLGTVGNPVANAVTDPAGGGAGGRAAAGSAADTAAAAAAAAAAGARLSVADGPAGANGAFAVKAAPFGCLTPAAPQRPPAAAAAATLTREAAEEKEGPGAYQLQARRSTSRAKPLQQRGNQHNCTKLPSGKGILFKSCRPVGNKLTKSIPLSFALECFEPPITDSREVQIQVLVQGNDLSKLPAAVAVQGLLGADSNGDRGALGPPSHGGECVKVMDTRGQLKVNARRQQEGTKQSRITVQPELMQLQDWRIHKVESVSESWFKQ